MSEPIMQEAAVQAIPAGYKQTEVGVIPEHWAVFSLGDIFNFKNGINKAKSFFGFGFPIVNYMDVYSSCSIDGGKIAGRVSVGDSERKNYSAIKNDVFFTRTSETVDEIGLASVLVESVDNTVFSGFLLRARQRSDFFVGNYMKYCFREKSIRNQIQGTASYTTRALTNGSLLSKILIPVPTKQEQTAIANVLSDSDALIGALEQLIAKKQAIKTATMQQLLTGRTRLPLFAQRPDGTPKGYKSSELGQIPEDWEVVPLGDICGLYQPVTISGSELKESGYPVYGANGLIGFYEKYNHEAPQVIVTCRGSTCGTVNYTVAKSWITGNAMVVDVDKNKNLDKNFTYYMLSHQDLTVCITGSGQPQIVRSPLAAFKVVLPEIEEQTAIATILTDMDNELQALTQKLEKARALKQGMMQQLLTGKIRLPLAASA
ncbi:TPA: restriction endonuclease subunit S [Aeromonas veronii]|uniref:restriction endonuclease subunit S n=1 Tax=Aeromonas veronii TaxID=654 RepID=UPI003D1B30C9